MGLRPEQLSMDFVSLTLLSAAAAVAMQVIAARYGVLLEKAGIALRGLFIINPEGIIQQITVNDLVRL